MFSVLVVGVCLTVWCLGVGLVLIWFCTFAGFGGSDFAYGFSAVRLV